MKLAFWDMIAPRPYTAADLERKALGGTEASLIRVAEGLDATVHQAGRETDEGRYLSPATPVDADVIVVLREPEHAVAVARAHPGRAVHLWLHDLPDRGFAPKLREHRQALRDLGVGIVCVSRWHETVVREAMGAGDLPRTTSLYNIVDVPRPATTTYDRNKLVYVSSPKKGLPFALAVFAHLRKVMPELTFHVANPGYYPDEAETGNGVVNMGPLRHDELLGHVASSLCVFFPNYRFPETFGLVFAEANALGTPVLTHGIGAAAEVLSDPRQIVPKPPTRLLVDKASRVLPALRPALETASSLAGQFDVYARTIRSWRDGQRPVVSGRPEFSAASVLASWRAYLDG